MITMFRRKKNNCDTHMCLPNKKECFIIDTRTDDEIISDFISNDDEENEYYTEE